MRDKCGNEIAVGDVVDIPVGASQSGMIVGMQAGVVVEVTEGGIVGKDGDPSPAIVKVNIPVMLKMYPGAPAPVYVTRPNPEARKKK